MRKKVEEVKRLNDFDLNKAITKVKKVTREKMEQIDKRNKRHLRIKEKKVIVDVIDRDKD